MGAFTEDVRQELSRLPLGDEQAARRELAALVRLAGRLHLTGGSAGSRLSVEVSSRSGAVVRRFYALLSSVTGIRPELWVREPAGVRTETTFGAGVAATVDGLGRVLGLFDADGRPVRGLPAAATEDAAAVVRAALLAVASFSAPGRGVHLEIRVPSDDCADDLSRVLEGLGVPVHVDHPRGRVVIKDGVGVGDLLVLAGADRAVAAWDDARARRSIRNAATRLTNADAANLRRTVGAATEQREVIDRAVARTGWGGLPEDLRSIALVRLVNPTASLAEVGELCEPPIGKSSVHRRMQRLRAIADGDDLEARA